MYGRENASEARQPYKMNIYIFFFEKNVHMQSQHYSSSVSHTPLSLYESIPGLSFLYYFLFYFIFFDLKKKKISDGLLHGWEWGVSSGQEIVACRSRCVSKKKFWSVSTVTHAKRGRRSLLSRACGGESTWLMHVECQGISPIKREDECDSSHFHLEYFVDQCVGGYWNSRPRVSARHGCSMVSSPDRDF